MARACLRPRASGFTLYEMLLTLAISGVITTTAVGLHGIVQETTLTTQVNEMMTHLALARSEAIKRGTEVVVCPSADGQQCQHAAEGNTWWHAGFLIYVDSDGNGKRAADEPIIAVRAGAGRRIEVKSSSARPKVIYRPSGSAGGTDMTIAFCDQSRPRSRYIVLSNVGRPRVSDSPPRNSKMKCA